MSLVHGFKIVVVMLAGLSCSAAWSQAESAKAKTDEAKAAPLPGTPGGPAMQGTYTGTTTLSAGTLQIGVAGSQMSMNANGGKEVNVEQYGMKVRITEDPQNGIKIERTTKKGGTDVAEKFEAKDVRELAKKSPEGFKLYEDYYLVKDYYLVHQARGERLPSPPPTPRRHFRRAARFSRFFRAGAP